MPATAPAGEAGREGGKGRQGVADSFFTGDAVYAPRRSAIMISTPTPPPATQTPNLSPASPLPFTWQPAVKFPVQRAWPVLPLPTPSTSAGQLVFSRAAPRRDGRRAGHRRPACLTPAADTLLMLLPSHHATLNSTVAAPPSPRLPFLLVAARAYRDGHDRPCNIHHSLTKQHFVP